MPVLNATLAQIQKGQVIMLQKSTEYRITRNTAWLQDQVNNGSISDF